MANFLWPQTSCGPKLIVFPLLTPTLCPSPWQEGIETPKGTKYCQKDVWNDVWNVFRSKCEVKKLYDNAVMNCQDVFIVRKHVIPHVGRLILSGLTSQAQTLRVARGRCLAVPHTGVCGRIRTKAHDLSVHTPVFLTVWTENCAGANNHLIYKIRSLRKSCELQAINNFFLKSQHTLCS